MRNDKNNEIKYLTEKIDEISFDKNRFRMHGEEKYLFGVVSLNDENTFLSKIIQYSTNYETICDLEFKIKISFNKAINYAYSEDVQDNYSFLNYNSMDEIYSYYYFDNALFRTSSLWDMLVHLYCLYYEVGVKPREVNYKKIFNPEDSYSNNFENKAKVIWDYLQKDDDINLEGEWKGNHRFVSNMRNKMTHRNSPTLTALSDFDINFKNHPSYLLKRIIEDYNVVSKFIIEILNDIEKDIEKNNTQKKIDIVSKPGLVEEIRFCMKNY